MSSRSDAEGPSGEADDDFNYDVEYKSKCTGLGALLGTIRNQEEGEIFDDGPDEVAPDRNRDDGKKRKKSGRKRQHDHEDEQYYEQVCDEGRHKPREYPKYMRPEGQVDGSMDCTTCGITLNSATTYKSHIEGAEHLRKVQQQRKKEELIGRKHQKGDDGGDKGGGEENTKFSTPPPTNDLRKMLCQTEEPVIGLHYVEELMPETNRDAYPPHYACGLCNVAAAPATSMFAHLTGIKHRTKYIGMRLGVRTAAMDGASAQEKARDLESEDGLRIDLLKTVFSDNRYPWPAGKSPWAAEAANIAGGGGGPSQAAAASASKEGDKVSLSESPTVQLLVGISQCKVKNDEDAMMAHDVSAELIKRIVEYKANMSAEKHAAALRGCCASLLTSLNAIMNMPCGSQTQNPQPAARQQPHAAPPPAAAFATANSASPTNSSSNASEQSSSYYNRPPRLSTNGTFEGGEHNSSSGYGSSAEAQGEPYPSYGHPPPFPPPPASFEYPPPPPPPGHSHYHR